VSSYKRITASVAVTGLVILMFVTGGWVAGARINTTRSIPVGLYWTSRTPIEKGAYVLFCPPENGVFDEARKRGYIGSGSCAGGYGYMMKKILAAKNDVVSVSDDGVRVNGVLLPQSGLVQADRAGRPLPQFNMDTYTLDDGELLLMSDVSKTSFDGRYFGPIDRIQVKNVVRPVLTW